MEEGLIIEEKQYLNIKYLYHLYLGILGVLSSLLSGHKYMCCLSWFIGKMLKQLLHISSTMAP